MELGVGALLRNCFLSMMAGSVHSGGAHVDRQPPLHSKDAVDFACYIKLMEKGIASRLRRIAQRGGHDQIVAIEAGNA